MGARFYRFWAGRPSGPAGWLALLLLKVGDVETNPGPKHTRTQVWICDICHREINRKQTSLRCNHSEHWVHLRCAHIRVDQYTDTWICHLHRGSRLPHATHTSDGGAYSPFRSILLVLTHDFIITCVYGPTGSDRHERKDAALRTIFVPFEAKGVLYAWGPQGVYLTLARGECISPRAGAKLSNTRPVGEWSKCCNTS